MSKNAVQVTIPSQIIIGEKTIKITFYKEVKANGEIRKVNRNVDEILLKGLKFCLEKVLQTPEVSEEKKYDITEIFVRSANDGVHSPSSRHFRGLGQAIDISRINGKRLNPFYYQDEEIRFLTDAIQKAFEEYPYRNENFGPGAWEMLNDNEDNIFDFSDMKNRRSQYLMKLGRPLRLYSPKKIKNLQPESDLNLPTYLPAYKLVYHHNNHIHLSIRKKIKPKNQKRKIKRKGIK